MSLEPDFTPDRSPDGEPLDGKLPPPDLRRLRAEGDSRVVAWFRELCTKAKWEALDNATTADTDPLWREVISSALRQRGEWWSLYEEGAKLEVLAAAADDNRHYLILTIAGEDGIGSYYPDLPYGGVPLRPGNSAAFLCSMPRSLVEEVEHEVEDPQAGILFIRPIIDGPVLTREIEAFTRGDHEHLFGKLIAQRLRAEDRPAEPILTVVQSSPRPSTHGDAGFLLEFPSGHAYLDARHEPRSGQLVVSGPYFLSSSSRPEQDICFDERSAKAIRATVHADLEKQGYRPIEAGTWVDNAREIFAADLVEMFEPLIAEARATGVNLSVQLKNVHGRPVDEHALSLLTEIEFRDDNGGYILPSSTFSSSLRSLEAASLFYAVTPEFISDEKVRINYHLTGAALPPCGGLEGLVEALHNAPHQSILSHALCQILSADLELSDEDQSSFELLTVIPLLTDAASDEIELSDDSPSRERPPISVICTHSHGAHIVSIQRSFSGLIDIVDAIDPLRFFPPDSVPGLRTSPPR